MENAKERILVVEPDLEISDIISRQTLIPMGYKVQVVGAAAQAIQEAVRFVPDVIIANLNLPGLSGKDLLVGLSAQGVEVPVVVIANKGMENDVIQAFRLGAADFISQPVREAEVVTAVERVLNQTRSRREKEQLTHQLNQTNQELQRRVRELTTIFAIGKAVTSITDPATLFDKIVEGAVFITEADLGWLHLRDDRGKSFVLSAHKNLPPSVSSRLNQTWDDGLSSLVALSGESFSISGEPLKRFKVTQLGQSALVVPVKAKKEVVGLLVVMRKKAESFTTGSQALLEAVADYASISLMNSRLYRAVEDRAITAQRSMEVALLNGRIMEDIYSKASLAIREPFGIIKGKLDLLAGKSLGTLSVEQGNTLTKLQAEFQVVKELLARIDANRLLTEAIQKNPFDLNELAKQAIERFQPVAKRRGVTVLASLMQKPVQVNAVRHQLLKVLEGLLYHALNHSQSEGKITLRLAVSLENHIRVSVQDQGPGINARDLPHLFDPGYRGEVEARQDHSLGLSLALIREVVTIHGGKIWVDSKMGSGTIIHFTLPMV